MTDKDILDLDNIRTNHKFAELMVSALCKPKGTVGAREWVMSIPARPTYDPDLVIGDSLSDIPKLIEEVERLREVKLTNTIWRKDMTVQSDFEIESKISEQMEDSIKKALEALGGYKFWMFGYHAARWVNYNRLVGGKNGNPFKEFVLLARKMLDKYMDEKR